MNPEYSLNFISPSRLRQKEEKEKKRGKLCWEKNVKLLRVQRTKNSTSLLMHFFRLNKQLSKCGDATCAASVFVVRMNFVAFYEHLLGLVSSMISHSVEMPIANHVSRCCCSMSVQ